MTTLLNTKSKIIQKNFTPFLDVYEANGVSVADMVIGSGSYFRHTLGIYATHIEAIKEGKKEFKKALKICKEETKLQKKMKK